MMARYRRMRIAKLILKINFAPTFFCMAVFLNLQKPIAALINRARKRKDEELHECDMIGLDLHRRTIAIGEAMQCRLSEKQQVELSAALSALRADTTDYGATVNARSGLPTTFVLLPPVLRYVRNKVSRRQQKLLAFKDLVSRIDSDTFYLDLLLWFILPEAFGEAVLGDLNEEYLIRKSMDGPARARSWYRHQVGTTVKDCLWRKIERLAAIGTLVDLLFRSHKK